MKTEANLENLRAELRLEAAQNMAGGAGPRVSPCEPVEKIKGRSQSEDTLALVVYFRKQTALPRGKAAWHFLLKLIHWINFPP